MALIKCPECGKEVSDSAAACVHCGFVLKKVTANKKTRDKSSKKLHWGIFSIIGALAIILLLGKYHVTGIPHDSNDLPDDIDIGETLFFGSYEQNNYAQDGLEKIEWIVLEKNDGQVLVISKYGLDCQPYNEDVTDSNWETCSLRSWLNNNFIKKAFSTSERKSISSTTVIADNNNSTQDEIFILSGIEVDNYHSEILALCQELYDFDDWIYIADATATSYAESQGATLNGGLCYWWLRSPIIKEGENKAGYIRPHIGINKSIGKGGIPHDFVSVRPAMWLNLD